MCSSSTGLRWAGSPSVFFSTAVSASNSRPVGDPTDIFLTDGVSEGEFKAIIDEELRLIRSTSDFPAFSFLVFSTAFLSYNRRMRQVGLRTKNNTHRRWKKAQGRVLPYITP